MSKIKLYSINTEWDQHPNIVKLTIKGRGKEIRFPALLNLSRHILVKFRFHHGNLRQPSLVKLMDYRTGGGVQLPLHQAVLRPQLQGFVPVEHAEQRRPGGLFVGLEDDGELEGRRDAGIREDAAYAPEAILTLHVQCYRCPPEPARLVGWGGQHVVADPGSHVTRKQQQLTAEGGSFGRRQTVFHLPGDVQLEEPLFVFQVYVNCRRNKRVYHVMHLRYLQAILFVSVADPEAPPPAVPRPASITLDPCSSTPAVILWSPPDQNRSPTCNHTQK